MSLNGDEEDQWSPPSEAEMKVLQARRERQDRVSRLMGDYLLKGYRMLGDACSCGTILLQDKQQKLFCVSCQELDSDVDKDNPALNAQAALSQVRERQLASQPSPSLSLPPQPSPSLPPQPSPSLPPQPASLPLPLPPSLSLAEEAVLLKLRWASEQLRASASVEASLQLCGLVRGCADALRSLRDLQQS